MQRISLILCLTLATPLAFSETYRWVDSTGKTMITDTPPPGAAKRVAKVGQEAKKDTDGLPFAVRRAVDNFPVTLYTAPNCLNECREARDLLSGRGVPFNEKVIKDTEDPVAGELKQLVGDAVVPSIKVGRQSVSGFESGAYNNLLDLAGYPKPAPGRKTTGTPAGEKAN